MTSQSHLSLSLPSLQRDGFCVIDNFVSPEDLASLTQEFDSLFDKLTDKSQGYIEGGSLRSEENGYPPGKHIVAPRSEYGSLPYLISLFNTREARLLVDSYCGMGSDFLMQIFLSHEYNSASNNSEWSRNNWLHFDPYPSLKFLLYLTDVSEENGASGVIKGSRALGKKYRTSLNLSDKSGLHGGVPHRLEDFEKEPQYTNSDADLITGSAGMLLILDTDCLHCGGIIHSSDVDRKCVILHNRPPNLLMPSHD